MARHVVGIDIDASQLEAARRRLTYHYGALFEKAKG
ncbi:MULTISPECIES: class I SAM-dependent methyltransferase [unclassified Mesorhizobium]|nr:MULTISPECIES: class I SAM-dependent methyltransferase [unclassified Mesorhizobium]